MNRQGFIDGVPISFWAVPSDKHVAVFAGVDLKGRIYGDCKQISYEALELCKPAYTIEYALLALERDIRRQL